MIFFPIDQDQLRAEHGVDRIQSFAQMPPAWKVVFCCALAAGLGNWFAVAQF